MLDVSGTLFREFYQAAFEPTPVEQSVEQALAVIERGVAFLQAANPGGIELMPHEPDVGKCHAQMKNPLG